MADRGGRLLTGGEQVEEWARLGRVIRRLITRKYKTIKGLGRAFEREGYLVFADEDKRYHVLEIWNSKLERMTVLKVEKRPPGQPLGKWMLMFSLKKEEDES
ncbi:hypothetical protein HPY42_05495 [Coprothermobacteraceae bacterium]|nr:hypothetical protein [Coprothermobacteraceae bacterium]